MSLKQSEVRTTRSGQSKVIVSSTLGQGQFKVRSISGHVSQGKVKVWSRAGQGKVEL